MLWEEDDILVPGKESWPAAWTRIFGGAPIPDIRSEWDGGDNYADLYVDNRVVHLTPDGATIWQWIPKRVFDEN